MLAIRCQFLQGVYQASLPGSIESSEWPPSPARLHAALVAAGWAWGDGEFPAEAAAALKWLEGQPLPEVAVPPGSGLTRTSPTTYVPRNLTDAEVKALVGHLQVSPPRASAFQRESGRVSRTFPARVVGDEPIWFIWPDASPSPADSAALERLAGDLQYLGSSRSPVVGAALTGRAGSEPWGEAEVFAPASQAGSDGVHLRVAKPGLTETLLCNRDGESRVELGPVFAYRSRAAEREVEPLDRGPFGTLLLRRRRGFGLTLSHAATVAAAYRAACLAVAGDAAPAALHGHGGHPHAAFLAFPNVGAKHSDGAILGVGLAVPEATPATDLEAIRATVAAVDRLSIASGKLRWRLEELRDDEPPWTLQAQRWAGPARRWSTATPVVLDRYPNQKRGFSMEDAIKLAFRNALLPEPSDGIETSPTPMLPGGVTPNLHSRPERLRGLALHVTVEFPRPIVGPIMVGKGRYLGLGLFAPLPDRRPDNPDDSRQRP